VAIPGASAIPSHLKGKDVAEVALRMKKPRKGRLRRREYTNKTGGEGEERVKGLVKMAQNFLLLEKR